MSEDLRALIARRRLTDWDEVRVRRAVLASPKVAAEFARLLCTEENAA